VSARFDSLLRFMAEADGLKLVQRGSWLIDGSRAENSAEHTWHASLLAVLLHPMLEGEVDLLHALRMLQVHDLVEIDAGDAFAYDAEAQAGREERERAAADRIFAERTECRALWDRFEACETAEARFARACDKLQPLLLNVASGGAGWKRGGIRREQVAAYFADLDSGDPAVVAFRDYLLERATRERMFSD
jgi:putative hydrolase of HD superfamily